MIDFNSKDKDLYKDYSFKQGLHVKEKRVGNYNVCLFLYESNASLENEWSPLNSVVCNQITSEIENKFEAWNIYIIFLVTQNCSKELRYRIENDKYFSRKIVIDKYSKKGISGVDMLLSDKIFLDKILNLDTKKSKEVAAEVETFTSDLIRRNLKNENSEELYLLLENALRK